MAAMLALAFSINNRALERETTLVWTLTFPYSVWRAWGIASAYSRSSASVGWKAIDLAARPRSDGGELGIYALQRWRRVSQSSVWPWRVPAQGSAGPRRRRPGGSARRP